MLGAPYQKNKNKCAAPRRDRRTRETCRISLVLDIYHSFNAVGWQRIVKDNGIGSGLPKFLSFILSLSQIVPIQSTSWNTSHSFLQCTFRVFDTSWYSSSCDLLIGSRAILFVFLLFVSFPPTVNPEWMTECN